MNDLEKRIERLEYIARRSRYGDLLEQSDRKSFDGVDADRKTFDGSYKGVQELFYWKVVALILAIALFIKIVIK